jgi:hypothetical protein
MVKLYMDFGLLDIKIEFALWIAGFICVVHQTKELRITTELVS